MQAGAAEAFTTKRFVVAARAQLSAVRAVEQIPTSTAQQAALVEALGSLSWYAVLSQDYGLAVNAAERALAIDGNALYIEGNLAHAAMMLDDTDRASAILARHRGAVVLGRSWEHCPVCDSGAVIWDGHDDMQPCRPYHNLRAKSAGLESVKF